MFNFKGKSQIKTGQYILVAIAFFTVLTDPSIASGANTNTYDFTTAQSVVFQTGGTADIQKSYHIEGRFRLAIDFDKGTAAFQQVDAKLLEPTGYLPTESLDELFNMTRLEGSVINDTTIIFEGTVSEEPHIDVVLSVYLTDDSVNLTGATIPYCYDCYFFNFSAASKKRYSGGTGEPNNPYKIATVEDLFFLGDRLEDYDKSYILAEDLDLNQNLPGRKVFNKAVIAPFLAIDGSFDNPQNIPFTGVFNGNNHEISHLTITGDSYLGLFGVLGPNSVINNLGIVAANITGSGSCIGALAGSNSKETLQQNNSIISCCYSTGLVRGTVSNIGGLVGINSGDLVINCYSSAVVSGSAFNTGGLIGSNNSDASILQSYSFAAVNSSGNYTGGLVGTNSGSVNCCFSTGTVKGASYVGGLIGLNNQSIYASYSTCKVSGNDKVGGLVGSSIFDTDNSIASFWDIETSGQNISACGTGLSTTQMKYPYIFLNAGWDSTDEVINGTCDYWMLTPGEYPALNYSADNGPVMPEGLGTIEQPYLIRTARDLGTIWFEPDACYRLENSLDLSSANWSMSVIPWFSGTFDGNDYVIKNLRINGAGYLGLFGQLGSGAIISDLHLETIDIYGTDNYIGGLVGFSSNSCSIKTTFVTGNVTGAWDTGGLVGISYGTVDHCSSDVNIVGNSDNTGGLIGENYGSIISCSSSAAVSSTGELIGGLIGSNSGSVTNCWSTGSVGGIWYGIGGLAGCNDETGSIASSFNAGMVTGTNVVGGLVGDNAGTITNCYNAGIVNGYNQVGGSVGFNTGNIAMCYSRGIVIGNLDVGGFSGMNFNNIIACFWDIETSGQNTSDGGTGKTTAEMKISVTFKNAGWDCRGETENGIEDIWVIVSRREYPRLSWE